MNKVDTWNRTILPTILANYSLDNIYNADETGIFFRVLPNKSLIFKGEKCHGGNSNKERITALICSNASGKDKLPLLIIGKSLKPRYFKDSPKLPVIYRANKKAWMVGKIFEEWVRMLDKRMTLLQRNIALIIDNCAAHPNVDKLKSIKIYFLPPNTTSVIQPMDMGIINNLKVI